MSSDLNLGDLGITINLSEGEPASAKFTLPDGSVVTRPFDNGELNMRLGLGLGLGYQSAGGGGAPAPSTPPLDGTSPTGAWSMSRDLLTSFIGSSRYTDVSGTVSSLNDQTGNARHLTDGGARPDVVTAGPNSRTCADFDGSADRLGGPATSNFISASTGYMIVSFIPDTITLNAAADSNHQIMGCSFSYFGLFLQNTSGSPETIYALNNDGAIDQAISVEIVAGTAYVAEWRHEGGNIYLRVNGGTEFSAPSGNTGALAFGFNIGGNFGKFDGKVFEAAAFSTVPSSGQRNAIVADFMAHIGI